VGAVLGGAGAQAVSAAPAAHQAPGHEAAGQQAAGQQAAGRHSVAAQRGAAAHVAGGLGRVAPEHATSHGLLHGAESSVTPVKELQVDPLAHTGVDPLDNSVGTRVADTRPVSTGDVTGPIARGDRVGELPVVGQAAHLLPG
jgi:hypothetical protein